jgi:hypothetical protein
VVQGRLMQVLALGAFCGSAGWRKTLPLCSPLQRQQRLLLCRQRQQQWQQLWPQGLLAA